MTDCTKCMYYELKMDRGLFAECQIGIFKEQHNDVGQLKSPPKECDRFLPLNTSCCKNYKYDDFLKILHRYGNDVYALVKANSKILEFTPERVMFGVAYDEHVKLFEARKAIILYALSIHFGRTPETFCKLISPEEFKSKPEKQYKPIPRQNKPEKQYKPIPRQNKPIKKEDNKNITLFFIIANIILCLLTLFILIFMI